MGQLKGAKEFRKYTRGGKLTRMQSMKAKCFECNGEEASGVDCDVPTCALYPYSPYRGRRA